MKRYIGLLIFLSILFVSCGQQSFNYGWVKFFEKDYVNAERIFLKILLVNPDEPKNLKGLGVTQLMLKNYDEASVSLEKSYKIDKTDQETVLNLAIVYEAQQKNDQAIEYYNKYIDMSTDGKMKSEVVKLLGNLKKSIYKTQAQSLLQDESKVTDKDMTKGTVAIVPFDNRGEKGDYDALQRGIPQMMITDFGYVPEISLLERLRIDELLKEMKLSETGMVEKSTAQRLGKLLKAERIVSGSYAISPDNSLRMEIFNIKVATGEVSDIIEKRGTLNDFFSVQKDLSLAAIEKMGISLTEEQRKKIKTLPTESFFEFLAALKQKNIEDEQFTFQGMDFLTNVVVTVETPVTQVSNVTVATTPEVKTSAVNPVETPLPKPPTPPHQ